MEQQKKTYNIAYVVEQNLCTGCGICVASCPSAAINILCCDGGFKPSIDEAACMSVKGCDVCLLSCPGHEVLLVSLSKKYFLSDSIKEDYYIGRFLQCYTGHSNNEEIRYRSSSGGMVSQFLIFLLEHKLIDGALIASFDPSKKFLVKTSIARTKEEILRGKGSKYGPVSMHEAACELMNSEGLFVVVGLPCHIHGFRKLANNSPKIQQKIFGYFALYCSESRTFNLTDYVFNERKLNKDDLVYFAYRDEGCLGNLVAVDKNDNKYTEPYQSYYHPLRSFFIPRRCITCVDHYGELGDISFGDIHLGVYKKDKIGISSLVVRNKKFLGLLKQAYEDGYITLDEIDSTTLNESQRMRKHKKHRAATFLKLEKLLGRSIPKYDVSISDLKPIKSTLSYLITISQMFIGSRKSLWFIIRILKRKVTVTE